MNEVVKISLSMLIVLVVLYLMDASYRAQASSNRLQSPGWYGSDVKLIDTWAGIYNAQGSSPKQSYDKALILLQERNRRYKSGEGYSLE